MPIQAINPVNGKLIQSYESLSDAQVESKIQLTHTEFEQWKQTTIAHRAEKMIAAAALLRDRKDALALLVTQEMGKPINEAKAEIEKCAWVCEYYAEHTATFLEDKPIETDASRSFVRYQPLGVVLAVMPWNFPFWQVFRFAAPALMAGNGALLKHASNVPGSALAIESIFRDAGFPEALFSTLLIPSSMVGAVIAHDLVKAVTLTGSGPAGSAVAATAGKHIKKSVLELGGSDAYLILEDADLDHAAEVCTNSRLLNAGQSCIGAKRFIVLEKVYEQFLEHFKEKMGNAKMGDPTDTTNKIGPMAREDLRDELHQQVMQSLEKGAKCILGGQIPDREGAFYPPTILTEVKPGMPAYEEEFFGPVASVIKVKTETEAINVANDSIFGLGAAVFTQDLERGERIASQLEAGSCFVNGLVKSDPRLPFGGIKQSGYGRELSSNGMLEFVNAKTIWIK
jgi:succinate-semialdehyde dehydrogenase/glutarate-semialdehyde dehydrogenase